MTIYFYNPDTFPCIILLHTMLLAVTIKLTIIDCQRYLEAHKDNLSIMAYSITKYPGYII